ncbi:MAG: hypothetical protein V4850_14630 [Myxococcota bacterium]
MLLLALACVVTSEDTALDTDAPAALPLDAAFPAQLTDRYACGINWYVAYDAARTIRLQAGFTTPHGEDPGQSNEGPLGGEVATLQVYQGTCLMTPGCTDDIDTEGCGEQVIAHRYDATAGVMTLAADDAGVAGEVTGLALEGTDGEDPVSLATLDLPHADFWVE